jgi:hypothetical protein
MNTVMARFGATTQRSIAALMWTFLGFLYVCLISQWLTINRRDKLFTDYLDHSIQIAATERPSIKEVRAQLLMKASDLAVPIQTGEIDVTGNGKTLRAVVHYNADISMPIINQPVYQMTFKHELGAN